MQKRVQRKGNLGDPPPTTTSPPASPPPPTLLMPSPTPASPGPHANGVADEAELLEERQGRHGVHLCVGWDGFRVQGLGWV